MPIFMGGDPRTCKGCGGATPSVMCNRRLGSRVNTIRASEGKQRQMRSQPSVPGRGQPSSFGRFYSALIRSRYSVNRACRSALYDRDVPLVVMQYTFLTLSSRVLPSFSRHPPFHPARPPSVSLPGLGRRLCRPTFTNNTLYY